MAGEKPRPFNQTKGKTMTQRLTTAKATVYVTFPVTVTLEKSYNPNISDMPDFPDSEFIDEAICEFTDKYKDIHSMDLRKYCDVWDVDFTEEPDYD